MGNSCDEECPRGTYGFQCKEKCIETVGTEKATVKNDINIKAITHIPQEAKVSAIRLLDNQCVCLDFLVTSASNHVKKANMVTVVL